MKVREVDCTGLAFLQTGNLNDEGKSVRVVLKP